jgi:hypothetical protein
LPCFATTKISSAKNSKTKKRILFLRCVVIFFKYNLLNLPQFSDRKVDGKITVSKYNLAKTLKFFKFRGGGGGNYNSFEAVKSNVLAIIQRYGKNIVKKF